MVLKSKNGMKWVATILLLAFTFTLAGCGTRQQVRKLETTDYTLMYLDKKSDRDIDDIDLQHPIKVTEEIIGNHMASLFYEDMALINKERAVFYPDNIAKIRRVLAKALAKARPSKYIYFALETGEGLTEGELFANNGKLNWRISRIRGDEQSIRRWSRVEPAWRLVPKRGQRYFTKKILFEREIKNWIIADLELPKAEMRREKPQRSKVRKQRIRKSSPRKQPMPVPAEKSAPAKAAPSKELERKLKILNHLKEKQLIDENEYEQRRQKLLDEYL